jgi:hypothetical protein
MANELVTKDQALGRQGLQVQTLGDVMQAAQLVFKAGWAPKNMSLEQVSVAILHGLEAGLPPMFSVQNIAVINGRPSLWGDAIMALIHQSGLLEELVESEFRDPRLKPDNPDGWGWKVSMKRKGLSGGVTRTFTVADAKRANLWGKQGPWSTNPGRMLLIRARSFASRDLFADVLRGLTFREEAEDMTSEPERLADYRVVSGAPQLDDLFKSPTPVEHVSLPSETEPPLRKRPGRPRKTPEAAAPSTPPAAPAFPAEVLPDLPSDDPEPEEGFGHTPFDSAAAPPVTTEPPRPASKLFDYEKMAKRFMPAEPETRESLIAGIQETVIECNKARRPTEMPRTLESMSIEDLRDLHSALQQRLLS